MNYNIISSGSQGNAVLLQGGILVDCGVTFKTLNPFLYDIRVVLPIAIDEAILGVCRAFGQPSRVAYSVERMVAVLERDGLEREEALEYLEFNVFGAWVGPYTPVFVDCVDT